MQELMYLATRVVRTARYLKLVFGKFNRAAEAFCGVYEKLTYGQEHFSVSSLTLVTG